MSIESTMGNQTQSWRSIESAPTGDDDFYLVCAVDDPRSPFVVRGSIFKTARTHPVQHHLSMAYLTHWMPLPPKPLERPQPPPRAFLQKRPVAFRYKSGSDQWVYTEDEAETQHALDNGHDSQALYARDGT